ncbi:ribosomal protein S17 [Chloropicon primus]|uniref:Small ribosomal subunit protein uS17c n=1 Tax=Chloropicon primus TaxID=1764295 RepID=A0A5B8MWY9_9CHLO|nr:ribosomal protein S17 [Chloropicon primus]UPR03884.1 ribosomal protein S17 [Chloropicon primus]|eukprot:QDZ24676.1 ribosomal protein S17 [Chloropicon primus]
MNRAGLCGGVSVARPGSHVAVVGGARTQASVVPCSFGRLGRRQVSAMSATASDEDKIIKKLKGTVVSTKMDKTAVVRVTRTVAHPKYGKRMKKTKKFYAHDEDNACNEGDVVIVEAARPSSKTKRWTLKEIVEPAVSK